MAKKLYVINFRNRMTIADTEDEAYEHVNNGFTGPVFNEDDCFATILLDNELTCKMLMLHRLMSKSEKFDFQDVETAIRAFIPMDFSLEIDEIVDTICTWGERLEDLDDEEFMDWMSVNAE